MQKPVVHPIAFLVVIFSLINLRAYAQVSDKPAAVELPADAASVPIADGEKQAMQERIRKLENEVAQIRTEKEADELARLVAEADTEAKAPETETKPEERNFLWGALALQKLNPEISMSGDFLGTLIIDKKSRLYAGADDRTGFTLREAALHLQHVLDPFSMFKAAVCFAPEPHPSVGLEEMYMTWFAIIPSFSLTVGRFRQNFGIVNRWHEHDLDYVSYPSALTLTLGEEGITQTGLGIKWFMPPIFAHANELTIELTNAENSELFAGEFFSIPAALAHLKNYYDLSESTYLELGLSGIWGVNNKRGYMRDDGTINDEAWRHTFGGGIDLTLQWTPVQQAKYRSFTWRSEGFLIRKETARDSESVTLGLSESDGDRISWGFYSFINYQISTRWFVGVLGNLALPTIRIDKSIAWDIGPNVTFWQSEFVYLRLEYRHGEKIPLREANGDLTRRTDDRLLLQIDWAAGPHKHEKY
ncbi:MAG: hypothetical protein JXA30_11465 [Deltaproteobacteria bacterium]|nr:hypothetical protein [Deltaproteobacteria bacterium]